MATAMVTEKSPNERFTEPYNGCACAIKYLVHFFAVLTLVVEAIYFKFLFSE